MGGLTYTVSGSTETFQNVYTINATVGVRVPDSGGTGTVGGAVGISSKWGPQGRNFDSDIVIDAGVSATFENNPIPLTNFQLDGDQVFVTVNLPESTQPFGFTREELANGVAADTLAGFGIDANTAIGAQAVMAALVNAADAIGGAIADGAFPDFTQPGDFPAKFVKAPPVLVGDFSYTAVGVDVVEVRGDLLGGPVRGGLELVTVYERSDPDFSPSASEAIARIVEEGGNPDYVLNELSGYRVTGMYYETPAGAVTNDVAPEDVVAVDTVGTTDGIELDDFIYHIGGGGGSIFGFGGNDALTGGGVADTLDGGADDDTLAGGAGDDFVMGGDGNDAVAGQDGDDTVEGGAGRDYVLGGDGADVVRGGDGEDTLFGGAGDDTLIGGAGPDDMFGEGGANRFVFASSDGADRVFDFDVSDVIDLSAIDGLSSTGQLLLDEIDGEMLLVGSGTATVIRLDLDEDGVADDDQSITIIGTSIADFSTSAFLFIEDPAAVLLQVGTAGDDLLTGTSGNDTIDALDGRDSIDGLAGDDSITAGAGSDAVEGGDGNDTLFGGDNFDTLVGGAGNDVLDGGRGRDLLSGGLGDDALTGGSGLDTYIFEGDFGHDVITDFYTASLEQIDLRGLSSVYSTADVTFEVINGSTVLTFDQGGDGLVEATNSITLDGVVLTATDDQFFMFNPVGTAGQNLSGTTDDDTITGTAGNDTIVGLDGRDDILGGDGADSIDGDRGGDSIYGEGGDDTINGGDNFDGIFGGDGNDVLSGGKGWDTIDGGAGDDELIGNGGNDRFVFEDGFGNDTIADFSMSTAELIDLSGITGITDVSDLTFVADGVSTIIRFDLDGDGKADEDLSITVTGQVLTGANADQFLF